MIRKKIPRASNPWTWVPTLYLYEGIPYSIVMTTSTLIYTTMGISVAKLAFWTSLLYLPWTIKPLWSPYVEVKSTKRNWVIIMQIILGLAFILSGMMMPLSFFFPATIVVFALVAISSASHDIAADGFYMQALDKHNQTFFVGIRSTFYRIATLASVGLLPLMAGFIQEKTGPEPVILNVTSAKTSEIKPVAVYDPSKARPSDRPEIVVYPGEIMVPLYEKEFQETDSAVAYISLSSKPAPGEKIVVNITKKSGSKNLSLSKKQGNRFEFTNENWNTPLPLTFKVDHNLKTKTSAVFKVTAGNTAFSWMFALGIMGIFLLLLGVYHKFMLPQPAEETKPDHINLKVYSEVFVSFFRKPEIIPALLFFLFYRLGESQLVKVATPFLVDSRTNGGIGLTSAQYGIAYGTIGILSLTIGGILGGIAAARYGLKKLFWWMAAFMNVPNLGYLLLSYIQPLPGDSSIYLAIALEQFGYGFGFTAYMLFMLFFVGDSRYKTAEYAIGTSLMALGMMLPGMISGLIQEWLGYQQFFIYVMICTLPGMAVIPFLKIDPEFGIKKLKMKK